MWRRPELLVAVAALAATVIPLALDGGPESPGQWVGAVAMVIGAAALGGWRRCPRAVLIGGPPLLLAPLFLGPEPSSYALLVVLAYAVLAAERFSGRAAWIAGGAYLAYLTLLYVVSGDGSPGLIVLTLPGFVAGTALRLRRETAEELAERGRELEAEHALFAEVSVRNERARIASELHDIVGHALSAMVVQAAAGQRLADRAPEAANATLEVIAESARQGRADLQRLIALLAGTEVASPDLALIDEVVAQAARAGLMVTCRLEGPRDGVTADHAHIAFRVVQESLTNALRYAPGAEVRVLVHGSSGGRALCIQVENGQPPVASPAAWAGTGRGLNGLRERVVALGGSFAAGPTPAGGWSVQAQVDG